MSHLRDRGFSAAHGNPFAGLQAAAHQPPATANSKKRAGTASAGETPEEMAAAAERKAAKNREKRLKKKQKQQQQGASAAAASASASVNGAASDDEDAADDEEANASGVSGPAAVNVVVPSPTSGGLSSPDGRKARPSPLNRLTEIAIARRVDRVPTPFVPQAVGKAATRDDTSVMKKVVDEESEEESDAEEEEEAAASTSGDEESGSEEEEADADEEVADASEEEEDEEDVAAEVASLGYDAGTIAAARAQLDASGIPINSETLLLVVQELDSYEKERRAGKVTVFKKPPPKKAPTTTAPQATKPTKPPITATKATPAPPAAAATKQPPATTAKAAAKPTKATTTIAASAAAAVPAPASSTSSSPSHAPRSASGVVSPGDLDALAQSAWHPLTDLVGSAELLDGWTTKLERAATAAAAATTTTAVGPAGTTTADEDRVFAASFAESSALEILVRTALLEVYAPTAAAVGSSEQASAAKARASADASLLRLFLACLSGKKPTDQRFLLDQVKSLAKLLGSATHQGRLECADKVAKVVAAQRRVAGVHAQIATALAEEEKASARPTAAFGGSSSARRPIAPSAVDASEQSAATAALIAQGVDAATFFGEDRDGAATAAAAAVSSTASFPSSSSNVVLKRMWTSVHSGQVGLARSEVCLGRFAAILTKSPAHALQLTFHLLEREVQDRLAHAQKQLGHHAGQTMLVASQRANLQANKLRELQPLQQHQSQHDAREKELLKRKAELLNELDKLEASLQVLSVARGKAADHIRAVEAQSEKNAAELQRMHEATLERERELQSDVQAADAVHTLVVGTYERLTQANASALQKLVNSNAHATAGHLTAVASTLVAQAQLCRFLADRSAFCTKQLEAQRAERLEAEKFGIAAGSRHEVEKVLHGTLKEDAKVLSVTRGQAVALVRKVAKVQAVAIPPSQLHALYSQLLHALEAKQVDATFDLKALRDTVATLAAQANAAPTAATLAANTTVATAPSKQTKPPVAHQAAVAPASVAVEPTAAGSPSSVASDPFASGTTVSAADGKPQRQSFAARKAAKAAAVAAGETKETTPGGSGVAAGVASESKQPPSRQPKQQQPKAQPNGGRAGAKPANGTHAAPSTNGSGSTSGRPVASASSGPSAPVKTWSTSVAPVAPSLAGDDAEAAFPSLSMENIQRKAREEKATHKTPTTQQQQQQSPPPPTTTAPASAAVKVASQEDEERKD